MSVVIMELVSMIHSCVMENHIACIVKMKQTANIFALITKIVAYLTVITEISVLVHQGFSVFVRRLCTFTETV